MTSAPVKDLLDQLYREWKIHEPDDMSAVRIEVGTEAYYRLTRDPEIVNFIDYSIDPESRRQLPKISMNGVPVVHKPELAPATVQIVWPPRDQDLDDLLPFWRMKGIADEPR